MVKSLVKLYFEFSNKLQIAYNERFRVGQGFSLRDLKNPLKRLKSGLKCIENVSISTFKLFHNVVK